MHAQAIRAYFLLSSRYTFSLCGGQGGQSKNRVFLLMSREVSQLGYMLLHKLYINLAIAVIFMLISSLSDLSMKICLVGQGPLCILKDENLFLAQILKRKPLKAPVGT